MFLPKEEGCRCSSSSSTPSSVNWSFRFDDAACFPPRVPVDVIIFLFFGADGWVGTLSLLAFTGVAVSVSLLSSSYWLSSSAMFALTTAS